MDLKLINNQVVQLLLTLPTNAYVDRLAHANGEKLYTATEQGCAIQARPKYAGEIEGPALFLWVCLLSTLIRHENETFQMCFSDQRNLNKRRLYVY